MSSYVYTTMIPNSSTEIRVDVLRDGGVVRVGLRDGDVQVSIGSFTDHCSLRVIMAPMQAASLAAMLADVVLQEEKSRAQS